MNPPASSPDPTDLQKAASTFPDGPNVAPSAHEHEAAQGKVPPQDGTAEPGSGANAADDREQRIRNAAYDLSRQRGFAGGRDVDDWLEAEKQVDSPDAQRQRTQGSLE